MERINSNKLLISSILVLIGLNSVTLTGLWFLIYSKPPAPPMPGNLMPRGDRMFSEMNFDTEQSKALELLHQNHFMNIDSTEDELHQLRTKMVDELFKTIPNTDSLNGYAMQMGVVQAEFEKNVFRHFLDLKAICRPDQLPKLKTTLTEIIDHMHRRPPPSPLHQQNHNERPGRNMQVNPVSPPDQPPSPR
ncbi:MAG: hypothetical protein OEM52_12410 [bacterium]|nr:hypothetical protein [bacterium]